mmetsp:Transcript_37000/g.97463  ORF Transcript_37000/g.97463 Transcript_37000/m.97463 type:complete len:284 (+) Transcript_37000:611-1462(+)
MVYPGPIHKPFTSRAVQLHDFNRLDRRWNLEPLNDSVVLEDERHGTAWGCMHSDSVTEVQWPALGPNALKLQVEVPTHEGGSVGSVLPMEVQSVVHPRDVRQRRRLPIDVAMPPVLPEDARNRFLHEELVRSGDIRCVGGRKVIWPDAASRSLDGPPNRVLVARRSGLVFDDEAVPGRSRVVALVGPGSDREAERFPDDGLGLPLLTGAPACRVRRRRLLKVPDVHASCGQCRLLINRTPAKIQWWQIPGVCLKVVVRQERREWPLMADQVLRRYEEIHVKEA